MAGSSSHGHDDVIKCKHFPGDWPFVRGIHRSPVNSPHKDQWRGALMFSLMCVWINDWVNNHEAGDLRRYRPHYDAIAMGNAALWLWWCHDNAISSLITGYSSEESIVYKRIPVTNGQRCKDLCFPCCQLEQIVEQSWVAIDLKHNDAHTTSR